ncbi:AT-hook motif nuclear-localized protein 9-like [Vicia villosa]|uniref:AT-hook motif nuclear-localized protein 9-like n=1 Tax=Vicia villosa TaxID=3911 RepID=UPI00273BCE7D|nr:AT-hook motif nuclear-localized protein 9-like [Vicia villosa]
MGDQNLNLPVTISLSSTQNGSETTNNANNTVVREVIEIDAGSDTGEKSEPKSIGSDTRVKRPRGRPRKYQVGENKSPMMSVLGSGSSELAIQPFGSEVKRGRGRPRGSGKLQILASIGGCVAETAGGSMTPHVLTVNPGEDVVGKIFTFFHKCPRGAVCILSAAGCVSTVILRQTGGGSLRYEGHFQILSLTGSCTFTSGGAGGAERKIGTLSVSLAKSDGTVFGGGVESSLIAATPIQLILATFKQNISNQIKRKYSSPTSTTVPNMVTNQDSSSDNNLKVPRLTLEGEPSCLRATATKKTNDVTVAVADDKVKGETTTNGQSDSVGDGVIDLDSQTMEPVNANSVP